MSVAALLIFLAAVVACLALGHPAFAGIILAVMILSLGGRE